MPSAPTLTVPVSGLASCVTASSSAHAGAKTARSADARSVLRSPCCLVVLMVLLRRSAQVELRGRVGGARVVRPVHLRVAVRATARHEVVDARLARGGAGE